jgi:hypothetical protein
MAADVHGLMQNANDPDLFVDHSVENGVGSDDGLSIIGVRFID